MNPSRTAHDILAALKKDPKIRVECSACFEEFPLKKAELFHGESLTPAAVEYLKGRKKSITDRRAELKRMKKAPARSGQKAIEVGFGKTVEKVAPMLPGFPFAAADCRALFEPIDYVIFQGLSTGGEVTELTFSDIKSGRARLKAEQARIKDVINRGRIEFKTLEG